MKLVAFAVGLLFVGFGAVLIRESRNYAHVVAGALFILAGVMFMIPGLWK